MGCAEPLTQSMDSMWPLERFVFRGAVISKDSHDTA